MIEYQNNWNNEYTHFLVTFYIHWVAESSKKSMTKRLFEYIAQNVHKSKSISTNQKLNVVWLLIENLR